MLLTRSPLRHLRRGASFDLHVLSTPPAFVLSQDQTLRKCLYSDHANVDHRHHEEHPTEAGHKRSGKNRRHSSAIPKESHIEKQAETHPPTGGIGIDFWHAVEFSRSGRTPDTTITTAPRATSVMKPHPVRLAQIQETASGPFGGDPPRGPATSRCPFLPRSAGPVTIRAWEREVKTAPGGTPLGHSRDPGFLPAVPAHGAQRQVRADPSPKSM